MAYNSKEIIEKYYFLIFLLLGLTLICYSVYGIYEGNIKFCARGPACSYFSMHSNKVGFYSVTALYSIFGIFFIYLFFRERKKSKKKSSL